MRALAASSVFFIMLLAGIGVYLVIYGPPPSSCPGRGGAVIVGMAAGLAIIEAVLFWLARRQGKV
jgi:hypothetical protein